MKSDLSNIISDLIKEDHYQGIINSEDFYFEKLKELFSGYKTYNIVQFKGKMEEFINKPPEIFHFQEFLEQNKGTAFFEFLELIGRMISICDGKGYNINNWNPYQDKRSISPAIFTQKNWTYCFFKYSLNNFSFDGWDEKTFITFQYAIRFIENPVQNVNITSQNHRGQICDYFELKNESEIITLFPDFTSLVKNGNNKGVLIASILYHASMIKNWMDSVIGLMASDSTGWQDDFIKKSSGYDAYIIWNSKRPSGTKETIKFLRQIILEGNSFNLYYCSSGYVNYVANVIDFAEDQKELDAKNWSGNARNIFDFHKNFADYVEGKKSAKIVFLASAFQKIENIPVSDFVFYKDYSPPRQDNLSPLKAVPTTFLKPFVPLTTSQMKKNNIPLNLILFGPPGTGKTYNTINKAVSIIEGLDESELEFRYKERSKLKERFDKLIIDDWDNPNGQIEFITFHQSMSYEDFIEGIKPDVAENQTVIYNIEPGIFKLISNIARDNWLHAKKGIKDQLPFEESFNNLKDEWQESQEMKFPLKRPGNDYTILEFTKSSIRFKKASGGTGHTLSISTLRDFYYGIREAKPSGVGIYYPALLKRLKSYQPLIIEERNEKPYILIIDEINRGNVSQIFGELITLIEEDKRLGNDEALEAILPYSKEKFGVPPNLYIIGTMNTADRSIEAIDTALRRRFCFEEMSPRYDLKELNFEIAGYNAGEILLTINKRIEKLLDKDHAIGHSYFIRKVDETREEKLLHSFYQNIIPLLQEYFFGDFGKIGLVLGQGFVKKKEWNKDSDSFADFDYESATEFEDRSVYEIIDYRKENEGTDKFLKAIKRLMNEKFE